MAPPADGRWRLRHRHRGAGSPASAGAASSPSRRWGRGVPTPATRRPPLRVVPARSPRVRPASDAGTPASGDGCSPSCPSRWWWSPCWPSSSGRRSWPTARCGCPPCSTQLALEQSAHRQSELAVAELETPSRIVAAATGQLHMVRPANVIELPYVSLSVPLPTPKVTPAPAPPPPTATTASCGRPRAATTATRRSDDHRDDDADVDAMSVTTRHEPHRARAGSGRQTPTKAALGEDAAAVAEARHAPTARPARPVRRPTGGQPTAATGRPAATGTAAEPRPHRPPAKVVRLPVSRPRRGWAERHLPAPDPPRPPGARRGDAAAGGAARRRAGPPRRRLRGGGAGRVLHLRVAAGAAGRDLRPRRVAPRPVGADRRRRRRRLPGGASRADGARAVADPPRPGHDPRRRSCTGRSGYVVLARQLPQSTGQTIAADAFPGITLIADSKRVVPNGNLAAPGRRVHQRGRHTAPPDSSTGTTSCWREPTARRRSWSRLRVWRCHSRRWRTRSPRLRAPGIELTLDTQLQYESEQALAKAIESSDAVSGTAVVMDVKTGQILSMANLVATHPNAPGRDRPPATPSGATGASSRSGRTTRSTRPRATSPSPSCTSRARCSSWSPSRPRCRTA